MSPSIEINQINGSLANGHTNADPGVAGHSDLANKHLKDVPVLDLFSLRNQGVIVTGGARGLGLCLATSFLQAGASSVTCIDILPQPDSEDWQLAESTAKASSSQLRYRQLDITNEDAVASTFSSIFEESSVPVTGLCAAAGIQQMIPSLEYPAKDFRRIMEVNVTGTFLTCQAAAREFKKRDVKGSIAVIASMSGSIANKGLTCLAYNTSKSALLQMCRSAAAEWGPLGIRINTLSPGYIGTAMTDGLLAERPDLKEEWLRGSMLERISTPDEFRGPALYLLSRASSFMTGADLIVDGGHTAY